jgi:hypothetical protein
MLRRVIWYILTALMMETVNTSETSVSVYQTTRRNIPKDSHLHTRCRKNPNSREKEFNYKSQYYREFTN